MCSHSRFGTAALDLQRFKNVSKKALLTLYLLVSPQNETSMCIYENTLEHKHQKGLIQDFSIALLRAYFFCFSKMGIYNSNTWFSKTNPLQLLNNKYVCSPKYNYYSILLPIHLSIYFVWCSFTRNVFLPLIKKCAYTCIFIQKIAYTYNFIRKLALHMHFYFHALYIFNNTNRPVESFFWNFKVLLRSFIDVYWNEASKRFKKNPNCI